MKVGIFLTAREETEGGGYWLTNDIFENFIKDNKKKNLFFVINNDHKNYYSKKLLERKIKFKKIIEYKKFFYIKNFILNLLPILNSILLKLKINQVNNIFEKEGCNLIYFISSEYRSPLNISYISTVWDLQFKTHPQFPEVGSVLKRIYKNIVIKNFLVNSKFIITGTNTGLKEIKKYFNISYNKIIKNPHPISKKFFKKIKKNKYLFTRYNIKKKYFFYPANFWKHKNHEILIKMFELIQNRKDDLKNYQLILVGAKKNNYDKIKAKIKEKSLEKKIIILDFVNHNDLLRLYDKCQALIYPSFSGPENLPPLEAMARKKPVIISKYPGSKEQLGKLVFYFDPNKATSLIKQVVKTINLIKNKKLLKKIVKENYNLVKKKSTKNYIGNINYYLK